MAEKRKRIALDMDEVIADVTPKFLASFEEATGRKLTKEEFWGRKVYEMEGGKHIRSVLFEKGFLGIYL